MTAIRAPRRRLDLSSIDDKVRLGKAITERRKEMSLSIIELSRRGGISAAYLRMIEHGQRGPSMEALTALAVELHAHVMDYDGFLTVSFPGWEPFTVEPTRTRGPTPKEDRLEDLINRLESITTRLESITARLEALEKK